MLESFLSGGTFTDLLTEMSDYIDIGEQDKALAQQIAHDQETLAALHQTVADTRDRTNVLRMETAAQKRTLDASLKSLKVAKAELAQAREGDRAQPRDPAVDVREDRPEQGRRGQGAGQVAAAAQKKLAAKISEIVRRQSQAGRIPSEYNGTLSWPMSGNVTQNFGCTGFSGSPRGSCPHFHSGIDIVAPEGTKVRASGDGVVGYIGWNYADGPDPAWIVIIVHSNGLQTWYAHMKAKFPGGIKAGSRVTKGQVIGYEGNTGHSTGAHLHWAVMFNGSFVNPRLFL